MFALRQHVLSLLLLVMQISQMTQKTVAVVVRHAPTTTELRAVILACVSPSVMQVFLIVIQISTMDVNLMRLAFKNSSRIVSDQHYYNQRYVTDFCIEML
jgi:hypothetical protein